MSGGQNSPTSSCDNSVQSLHRPAGAWCRDSPALPHAAPAGRVRSVVWASQRRIRLDVVARTSQTRRLLLPYAWPVGAPYPRSLGAADCLVRYAANELLAHASASSVDGQCVRLPHSASGSHTLGPASSDPQVACQCVPCGTSLLGRSASHAC